MKKKLIRKILFETPSIEVYENDSRSPILRNENVLFDDERPENKKRKLRNILDW